MILIYEITIKSIKTQTFEPSVSWKLGYFNTLLSPENELCIVRKPKVRDFSFILTELPRNNPDSDDVWEIDLRSGDLRKLDLKNRFADLIY